MGDQFKPLKNFPPTTLTNRLLFTVRVLIDFQVRTVYMAMKRFLPDLTGRIVDVGAGDGPYRHLVNTKTAEYYGLDIEAAEHFGYTNRTIVHFDGAIIPFESSSMDHFICTEVLEHVENPETLINEIFRVLRPGGRGVVTIPWSARYHYIPYDYHRFTPTALGRLFSGFSSTTIEPRGTDITVIVSKIIVVYARLCIPRRRRTLVITAIPVLSLLPLIALCVVLGHVSILLKLGSVDDPLGYTIWVQK
jgi:SAM-dependent methyltransferase